MTTPSPTARFTVADFDRMGGPAGFRYRLPALGACGTEDLCIAEGRVEEHEIRPGVSLVTSDVRVHHHYESTSMTAPRFCAIVMVQERRARGWTAGPRPAWPRMAASARSMGTRWP